MTTPARPLSYDASKCVLQYMTANQRLHIRLRCPTLRTTESLVPLKFHTLGISILSLRIDQAEYQFCSKRRSVHNSLSIGCNEIRMYDHRGDYIGGVDLGAYRSLEARRSFLMHKFFGGRREPITIEKLVLQNLDQNLDKNLYFPRDMRMKMNSLEVGNLDAQILQQLTSHVVGGPLRSITALYLTALGDPRFDCELFANAHKLEISIIMLFEEDIDSLFKIRQKEVVVNNGRVGQAIDGVETIVSLALELHENREEMRCYITINTDQNCMNTVMDRLCAQPGTRQGVVDDVEYNQFNIPCICLPMGAVNELNVYGIPGVRTGIDLKIVVVARGTARINE